MAYIPHTPEERQRMLARMGCDQFEDLLAPVPEGVRLKQPLDVAPAAPEWEVRRQLESLAATNRPSLENAMSHTELRVPSNVVRF